MRTFIVEITGTTPLLMNKFTDAAMEKATNGSGSALIGSRGTPREIAESKVYRTSDGTPCIPTPNVFRCLIDAGIFFKAGKNKVTTSKSSLIPAALSVSGIECVVRHQQPMSVDIRAVVIPSTGGRIAGVRPRFDDWKLSFEIVLDEGVMDERLLREIVDAAGSKIGLGDFRPARKGPFGKFKVTSWKEA